MNALIALSEEEGISHLPFVVKAKEMIKVEEENQLQVMMTSNNNHLHIMNYDDNNSYRIESEYNEDNILSENKEERYESPKQKVRPVSLPRMYESPSNQKGNISSMDWSNLVGGMHISGVVRDRERQSFEISLFNEKKKEKWKLMKVKEERHAMEG